MKYIIVKNFRFLNLEFRNCEIMIFHEICKFFSAAILKKLLLGVNPIIKLRIFPISQTPPSKWLRVHRTHHRYTDTCADPHNSHRGFFFSHVGWLMMKHHPAVKKYGKNVDMSDITADPVIRFVDK